MKEKQKKTATANETNYTLVRYTFCNLWPEKWNSDLEAPQPTQGEF